jgi:hypothetical protein
MAVLPAVCTSLRNYTTPAVGRKGVGIASSADEKATPAGVGNSVAAGVEDKGLNTGL